ncbi:type I restriction endonuclease [Argonema antarcticum]|uniref:type I restriction endonuclease n=1 Tax=Argonema antarcticum TaxID=2942763 RepID=UPI0020127E8D|nr:type I restriction endonuclease [Argonema antarcticum]MCL1470398.1 type I restriction enzyme HsdR N-terminal domain-containing protein [Argonema antarcticum A004/B2]
MGFIEDIAKVSEQVRKKADQVTGEEATKQSLILPFFSALGYDIWDTAEVNPEYISDAATKKQGQFEKVDYAIAINGTIVMLVEAKARNEKPEAHDGQLRKYFTWTVPAKVGIVTNGVEYRFFTDLDNKNIMDKEPFFSFNVLKYDLKALEDLKLFHRDNFDTAAIIKYAEEMVYVKGMTQLVGDILRSPSEKFIRFLLEEFGETSPLKTAEGQINKINSKVVERFKPIITKAIQASLVELMTRSISQEISQYNVAGTATKTADPEDIPEDPGTGESKIVTTPEELEAFEKIKAVVATSKYKFDINHKDTVSYFGVNLGKTTWWFLRLYLTPKKNSFVTRLPVNEVKSLASGFEVQEVSASLGDAASRVIISSVSDLSKLTSLILKCYETEAAKH